MINVGISAGKSFFCGMEIEVSDMAITIEYRQRRIPRSKKKRMIRKWLKRFGIIPIHKPACYQLGGPRGKMIVHPDIWRKLEAEIHRQNTTRFSKAMVAANFSSPDYGRSSVDEVLDERKLRETHKLVESFNHPWPCFSAKFFEPSNTQVELMEHCDRLSEQLVPAVQETLTQSKIEVPLWFKSGVITS